MSLPTGPVDLAVVGAGAAGIAAALAARGAGLSALVLEAKRRVGGRTWTREILPGVPVDLGASWLHSASLNPLAGLVRGHGLTVETGGRPRRTFLLAAPGGPRWADAAEEAERAAYFARCEQAIAEAGAAGRDVPIAAVLPEGPRWRPLFEQWIGAYCAADPDRASTLDYARYRDTGENWPIREGYGLLLERLAAGLPVALGAEVRAIAVRSDGVRLQTASGTVDAGAAIVTVSTAVLGGGAIRFDPPLPDGKRGAIEAVPLGRAEKVVLAFDRDLFGVEEATAVWLADTSPRGLILHVRPFGTNVVTGFLGGRFAAEMEAAGAAATVAFALERLAAIYGSGVRRRLAASLVSAWGSDPHIGGGYSAPRPGAARRRAELAAPVGGRLFFAGEATSPDFFTTVHGAWLSGIRAVGEARAALAGPARPA